MIYQDMLVGTHPYYVALGSGDAYSEHRHPEIELNLCISGSYELLIGQTKYVMTPNHLALMGSMVSHSRISPKNPDILSLSIEISPLLLMEFWEPFSKAVFPSPIYSLDQCDPQLSELLYEIVDSCQNRTEMGDLMINGNVYKICYYIYEHFIQKPGSRQTPTTFGDVQKIKKAIELIHNQYTQPLTLKDVAAYVQYSESHFCRVFKYVTGITFHEMLNRYRIRNACYLLKETTKPVSEIALQVGFADSKTFCYVFKQHTGHTPRTFRNDGTLSLSDFRL